MFTKEIPICKIQAQRKATGMINAKIGRNVKIQEIWDKFKLCASLRKILVKKNSRNTSNSVLYWKTEIFVMIVTMFYFELQFIHIHENRCKKPISTKNIYKI